MTSEKQAGDSKSYDDGIKYGEWSQEYMNDFINSFEENKRKKRVRKAVDEVIK